jgi:Protein of unknown function (DUF1524)
MMWGMGGTTKRDGSGRSAAKSAVKRPESRGKALLALALAGAVTAGAGCTAVPLGPGTGASPAGTGQIQAQLAHLTVASGLSMAGYSRARFHIWAEQGDGCNTRDVVLKRDGRGVTVGATCQITHGTWVSPYNSRTYTDPQQIDIDHLVPLANAWRSGAKNWTDARREQFANDLTRPQLLAVDATDNRAKGDQDPSQWRPPNRSFWCRYAQNWVTVKAYWRLTVTVAEKTALADMLGTCT